MTCDKRAILQISNKYMGAHYCSYTYNFVAVQLMVMFNVYIYDNICDNPAKYINTSLSGYILYKLVLRTRADMRYIPRAVHLGSIYAFSALNGTKCNVNPSNSVLCMIQHEDDRSADTRRRYYMQPQIQHPSQIPYLNSINAILKLFI